MFANIRDIVGGRSAAYERELSKRERLPPRNSKPPRSNSRGAIVGIDLDYQVLGSNNGMMMVSISGTA
jgi:uncharacterized protein YbjQ (UPF0145 family)